jgi:cytoskeletal protein CcmA (bactofilin family)
MTMFGKRKQQNAKGQWQEPKATPPVAGADPAEDSEGPRPEPETPPAAKPSQPAAAQPVQPAAAKPAAKPDAAKPLSRQPAQPGRPDPSRRTGAMRQGARGETEPEGRKLLVGRDIALSGEIQSCDQLVVEGHVEAELSDSLSLEVSQNGTFKGQAVIDNADIAGRYEGDLTVRERLYVRASGQVHGTIRYRALEIEGGGRIGGTMVELSDDDVARLRESEAAGGDQAEPAAAGAETATPAAGAPAGAGNGHAPTPEPDGETVEAPADAIVDPGTPNGLSR